MAPPKGNKFWKRRIRSGPIPKYENPEDLLTAINEYFKWAEENPFIGYDMVSYKGNARMVQRPKKRFLSIFGLCNHLGIVRNTWYVWKQKRDDLKDIIARAEEQLKDAQLEGAAVDEFNSSIVARVLGLANKQEVSGQIAVVSDDDTDLL
ncbi:MAG: terminase small subunit [Pseudomonadota bacterium]